MLVPNLGGSINVAAGQNRRALTEGIPDPAAVQRQKEGYARSLEDQLRKGVEVLAATHKQQTDLLHAPANQEKHRYNIALDQQVKQRELELSQQYNEQLMRLQQTAQVQRADLEQQACGLTLQYQQGKVQEEYIAQQQGIQKQHIEAQSRLDQDIRKLTSGVPGAQTLLERVQANVQAGSLQQQQPMPMAQYALPQGMVPAPAPTSFLPYAPPGARPVGYSPQVAMPMQRQQLSYVPGSISAPLGQRMPQQQISYVPPGNGMTLMSTVRHL